MKKLIFIFAILFALIMVTGCGARSKTVKFNPIDPATEENADTDSNDETNTDSSDEETDLGPDLAITSFIGETLDTTVGYHVVRGTTPKNTHNIKIDDYILSKYNSGQTEWSYIASADLGTLDEGENTYTVYALDVENNEIDSQNFTITYNVPDNLPSVGASGWIALIISFLISIGYFVINRLRKVYIKNI